MNCNCGVNKTFILEPISLSGDSSTIRVCGGVYTNQIVSCDNNNTIKLDVSGETTFNGTIKANLIDNINTVRGGAFIINNLDEIFNNPIIWYPKLIEGQIIITISGGSNNSHQIYVLKDINQFDNQHGWELLIKPETHRLLLVTSSSNVQIFLAVPKPFDDEKVKVYLNGVLQDEYFDYNIYYNNDNIILDFTPAPFQLDNNDKLRIIYN